MVTEKLEAGETACIETKREGDDGITAVFRASGESKRDAGERNEDEEREELQAVHDRFLRGR